MFQTIIRAMLEAFLKSIIKQVAVRTGTAATRIIGEKVAENAFEALLSATYKEVNTACIDAAKAGIDTLKKIPYNMIYDIASPKRILGKVFSKSGITRISHTIFQSKKDIENSADFIQYLKDLYITENTELRDFDSYVTDKIQYTGEITPFGQKYRNINLGNDAYRRQGGYFVKKEDLDKYREDLRRYNNSIKGRDKFEKRLKNKLLPKKVRTVYQWTSQKEWTDYLERLENGIMRNEDPKKYESEAQEREAKARKVWYEFFGTNKNYSRSAYENLLKTDKRAKWIADNLEAVSG